MRPLRRHPTPPRPPLPPAASGDQHCGGHPLRLPVVHPDLLRQRGWLVGPSSPALSCCRGRSGRAWAACQHSPGPTPSLAPAAAQSAAVPHAPLLSLLPLPSPPAGVCQAGAREPAAVVRGELEATAGDSPVPAGLPLPLCHFPGALAARTPAHRPARLQHLRALRVPGAGLPRCHLCSPPQLLHTPARTAR